MPKTLTHSLPHTSHLAIVTTPLHHGLRQPESLYIPCGLDRNARASWFTLLSARVIVAGPTTHAGNLLPEPAIKEEEMDPDERITDTREDVPPTRDVPPTEPREPVTEPIGPEEVLPATEPMPEDVPLDEPMPEDMPAMEPVEPLTAPPVEPRPGEPKPEDVPLEEPMPKDPTPGNIP